CASFEHDLGYAGETASLARVTGMDRQLPERDDAGGVEYRGRVSSVFECVASVEHGERLGESPGPEQRAAMPGLEHLVGPALPVALRLREAVGCERECLLGAVGDAQQVAVPHVR